MLKKIRPWIAGITVAGMILPQMPLSLTAQEAPSAETPQSGPHPDTAALSTAPQTPLLTAAQLDTMLGPIALYPDPLLAQILPAATVPQDVVMANRYVTAKKDPALIDQQPWNESVKALARYPDVLKMMDEKLDWTTELGKAYLKQPDDVFASVQNLRNQAASVGNLKDSPQQVIVHEKEVIKIMPADPQVIYVPTYPPTTVYTTPPPNPAVPLLAFGAGLAVGAWLSNDHDDYWYGRGAFYHGGYHGGGYYGGNNTVNINNNVNINNRNVNNINNVNRPANGTAGAGNGQRPGGGAAGTGGAKQRFGGGAHAQQRPAGGAGSGFSREASKPQQQGGGGARGGAGTSRGSGGPAASRGGGGGAGDGGGGRGGR